MWPKLFLLFALLIGCTNKEPVEGVFSDCDPLDPSVCALPFPSAFYERTADTPTGVQVQYGSESLPLNRDYVRLDPEAWNERDGHSIGSPILMYFDDVSTEGTFGHDNIGAYADSDARTVIVDTSTGERVPHWVEVDDTAPSPDQRLFILRPAQALQHGTR